ncbi:MAG: cation:proton antiporter [Candidatus Gracilibacteria bacterium]|nr:cation:proton antiporter [Candidatus Gracilibacteria bacterium]
MSAVFSTFVLYQSGGDLPLSTIIAQTGFKLLLLFLCFFVFFVLAVVIFPQKPIQNDLERKCLHKLGLISCHITQVFGLKWFTQKFYKVEILVPTVLFLLFILASFSHIMGLHAAIGAYLTGLILHVDMFHSPIDKSLDKTGMVHDKVESTYESLTGVIYSLANHFLGPIFFIYLGSQLVIDFGNFKQIFIFAFVLFLFVASFQFFTASLAAKYTAKLSFKDSVLVGFGMWPRDVLAFVILGIAISSGIIEEKTIFSTIVVVTILFLDIATPLVIKWWSREYEKQENQASTQEV